MEYRAMRRHGQSLSMDECRAILEVQKRGVLSVTGDGGHPYGVPLNFYFDAKDDTIYFHGAKEGHTVDSLKKDNRASFCVFTDGEKINGDWAYTVKSVIAFGTVTFISDIAVAEAVCRKLASRFTNDPAYIDKEIKNALSRVQVFALKIDHLTGKHIHEA